MSTPSLAKLGSFAFIPFSTLLDLLIQSQEAEFGEVDERRGMMVMINVNIVTRNEIVKSYNH
jgi:hypothetical protein